MINQYDALDDKGNTIDPAGSGAIVCEFEQCDEDDPDIYCWSVYGHLPELWSEPTATDFSRYLIQCGVKCLADCPDKETANTIAYALSEIYGKEYAPR